MTYISWSSDFALNLEDYLMYEHHTVSYIINVLTSLFGIMSQYDPKFDHKINIGLYDLYFMVQ